MDTYDNWDGERQRFFKKLKKIFKTMPFFIKRVHLLIGEVRHGDVLKKLQKK